LEPGGYILFVGRLVPEKEVHTLATAHRALPEPRPRLAIVGGDPDDSAYARTVADAGAEDCIFLGKLFGDKLTPVLKGALGYVQPSAVEGTSPMLLTAMSYGLPTLASDIPENHETVGDAGFYFRMGDTASLTEALSALIANPERDGRGGRLRERATREYSWDAVTARYEEAYQAAIASRASPDA
jgi:glycosyltransferase involved in cell wall biosynthesis